MKTLLKNDFIAVHGFEPISTKDAKDDDIIPHRGYVYRIEFYHRIPGERDDTFVKIELMDQDIKAIQEAIASIESEVKDLPYSTLPF